MKVIERIEPEALSVGYVKLAVPELLEILKSLPNNDGLKIEIGDLFDERRWVLEGIEDVEAHRNLIKVPIRIQIGSVDARISRFPTTISYDKEDRHIAVSLAESLRPFRRFVHFFDAEWSIAVISVPVAFFISALRGDISESPWSFIFTAAVIASALMVVVFRNQRSLVYLKVRESFWQRNSDKIVVGILMAFIGLAIGKADRILTLLLPPSLENQLNQQPSESKQPE